MLKIMRRNAGSWIIKIIFSIIVIVFVFWGVGSFQEGQANRVAVVNGDAIPLESYRYAYDNYVENLRQQYGNNLNRDLIRMFQVPKQVIDSLISRQLMLQEAEKLNIRVTDNELADAIQSMSAFQDAGVFNNRRYTYLLNQSHLTPEEFETSQRDAMTIDKLNAFVTDGVKVTDGEIAEWYNWQNASVDIEYVLFNPADVKDLEPGEEELETYFEENKETYRTDPKVKVRYLAFRPEMFRDEVQIDEADIEAYYYLHLSEYQKEKTVEARHILLKVDENAASEVVEAKRKKAEEILELAKGGGDFGELAKAHSEGPTGENGGLLGEFTKDDMVEPFSEAAFSMSEGDISDPVRTQFGWHLIKVEKITEAYVEQLDAVADAIRGEMIKEESKNLAYDRADDAFDRALDDEDFEKTASGLGMDLQLTDYFTKRGPATGFSSPAKLASAAFGLSGTEISDIITIGDNYYILQKTDSLAAEVPDLADVKDEVAEDLVEKMQNQEAQKKAEDFLASLKAGDSMETIAENAGVEVENTGFFKRSDSFPGVDRNSEIIEAAFSLTETDRLADTVFQDSRGFYVICFKERKTPDSAEFEEQRDTLEQQLISQKQQLLFGEWLERVRSESEISIEPGYLD